MIAVDSSVAVASLAEWHEAHALARPVLGRRPRIPAHALMETFSVLTRLPPVRRIAPATAHAAITRSFPAVPLALTADEHRALLDELPGMAIAGGAVYDALVAFTALRAKATLHTLDRRAARTYAAIGVRVELIG